MLGAYENVWTYALRGKVVVVGRFFNELKVTTESIDFAIKYSAINVVLAYESFMFKDQLDQYNR